MASRLAQPTKRKSSSHRFFVFFFVLPTFSFSPAILSLASWCPSSCLDGCWSRQSFSSHAGVPRERSCSCSPQRMVCMSCAASCSCRVVSCCCAPRRNLQSHKLVPHLEVARFHPYTPPPPPLSHPPPFDMSDGRPAGRADSIRDGVDASAS
ncbi:hypothetical protein GGS23DRAFT_539109 [Durotheca rogersii]|uniref:uncharacterized protein n=1 Tax=Durotheca rogersii TaxID=419775 RepID=UPI00221FCF3A|nr:uncharacterized protein GGS23DRAFT_539109 [Durotheca rogersii]KAI5863544.1 hypothetical protein GGS23DRAFT_539109 [Durotheca rogersii]